MKYTTINLDNDVKRKLKIHCAKVDVPMSEFVKELVLEKIGDDIQ